MFTCAQRVSGVIGQQYGGTSGTVAIQDGPEAGQCLCLNLNNLYIFISKCISEHE